MKDLKLRNLYPPFMPPRIPIHNLRATWAIIMIGKGIVRIKVMAMGGWKDLKIMAALRKEGWS